MESHKVIISGGDSGKKYPYTIGDVSSREIARSKAVKQAQAAYSAGYRKK